jgi:AcrR family transcriptional regulator
LNSAADSSAETPRPADSPGAGLVAFSRRRKEDNRERLVAAAVDQFNRRGYLPVCVEDIALEANVSRVTFYRHFANKTALAAELFRRAAQRGRPRFLAIRDVDCADRDAVRGWISALFAADRSNRAMLRIFCQAVAIEPAFAAEAQALINQLIAEMGEAIPAFRLDPDSPADRRRWLEAWLLVFEILDQSNHAALDFTVASDPLIIDILTDRFMAFTAAGAH